MKNSKGIMLLILLIIINLPVIYGQDDNADLQDKISKEEDGIIQELEGQETPEVIEDNNEVIPPPVDPTTTSVKLIPLQSLNKQMVFKASDKLPTEFKYLLESIQTDDLSTEEKSNLFDQIILLDQVLIHLTKEESYFIIKSEIYKFCLRIFYNQPTVSESYESSVPEKLGQYLEKYSDELNPFESWLLGAIQIDLKLLFDNRLFRTFNYKRKNSEKFDSPQLITMDKKFKLLLPIYQQSKEMTGKQFNMEMKKHLLKLVGIIIQQCRILASFSRIEPLVVDTKAQVLHAFTQETIKTKNKSKEKPGALDNILNNDNLPNSLFPTPMENYTPPDVLPEPTNDWLDELQE